MALSPVLALLAAALTLAAQPPRARRPLWHAVRAIRDVTGDGRADTLTLVARGARADSLDVTFRIRGAGRELFRDDWNTADQFLEERDLPPGQRASADSLARIVRRDMDGFFADAQFEPASALPFATRWPPLSRDCDADPRDCVAFYLRYEREVAARVRRGQDSVPAGAGYAEFIARIDRAPFDTALVRRVGDEMRRRALPAFTFSYGYETSRTIVWSPLARRFFPVFECC